MDNNDKRGNAGGEDGFYDFDFGDGDAKKPDPSQSAKPPSRDAEGRAQSGGLTPLSQRANKPAARQNPTPPDARNTGGSPPQSANKPAARQNPTPPAARNTGGSPPQSANKPAARQNPTPPDARNSVPKNSATQPDDDDFDEQFEVDFDFEREYRDAPDDDPLRTRQERRKGCLGGITHALFIICTALILACLGWLAATDVLGLNDPDTQVQVLIPRDSSIDDVASILYDSGLIKYKFLFRIYAKFSHADEVITGGTYVLNTNYDYYALVSGMSPRTGKRVEIQVTLTEGMTLAQMFQKLEESGVCFADDLWEAAANTEFDYDFLTDIPPTGDRYRLEGFLFPETYNFYLSDSPARVIRKLLDQFGIVFNSEMRAKAEEMGYTVRDIVIIASIIEKEAGHADDRAKIASVIYNRLGSDSYPRLEIDATIWYAIAETDEPFSINLDNPYNTYLNNGLPPGPISNPGKNCLNAALNPEKTNYYFYALSKIDRKHEFFQTYDEHRAFIRSDAYGG